MAKDSIRDFSATSSNNSDIQSVDISEGCAPSGLNNAIREVMTDLKNVSTGTVALETPVADSFSTDTISEKTSAAGVTIDSVLLKDNTVTATSFTGNGSALTNLTSGNLTGALPAIDGSALTGVSGGKVLQVVQTTTEAEKSTTSTAFAASGIYVNITPSSTSSKVLVSVGFTMGASPNGPPEYKLYRGTTALANARMSFQADANWNGTTDRGTIEVLDSPNTTALTTYQIYFKRNGTGAARIGRSGDKTHATTSTYVTAMEIAG